jgi:hypothetical protein
MNANEKMMLMDAVAESQANDTTVTVKVSDVDGASAFLTARAGKYGWTHCNSVGCGYWTVAVVRA